MINCIMYLSLKFIIKEIYVNKMYINTTLRLLYAVFLQYTMHSLFDNTLLTTMSSSESLIYDVCICVYYIFIQFIEN